MKLFFILFFTFISLSAKTYYSKTDPYEIRNISSNVSGEIKFIDESMIGKKLTKRVFITIDSQLDAQELKFIKTKITILTDNINVNKSMLQNYNLLLEKKRKNYKQIEHLKIKSRIEKDKEFYDLLTSENASLNVQKEINNLKTQLQDLNLRKVQLEKSLQDKSLQAEGFVLYSLDVKVGQVVSPATPLAKVADLSKAILTIYLDAEDFKNIHKKTIYLDEKLTHYKIDRLSKISDTKNISKYKAQIIIKAPKLFSKLVKVELK